MSLIRFLALTNICKGDDVVGDIDKDPLLEVAPAAPAAPFDPITTEVDRTMCPDII